MPKKPNTCGWTGFGGRRGGWLSRDWRFTPTCGPERCELGPEPSRRRLTDHQAPGLGMNERLKRRRREGRFQKKWTFLHSLRPLQRNGQHKSSRGLGVGVGGFCGDGAPPRIRQDLQFRGWKGSGPRQENSTPARSRHMLSHCTRTRSLGSPWLGDLLPVTPSLYRGHRQFCLKSDLDRWGVFLVFLQGSCRRKVGQANVRGSQLGRSCSRVLSVKL